MFVGLIAVLVSTWLVVNYASISKSSSYDPVAGSFSEPSATWNVLIPSGPEHRDAVAGQPEIRRWRPVTLGVNRDQAPPIGTVLRFAPFDDREWRCRVRSVRPVEHGVAINADALDESGALLMIELRADAVVVRFDRRGAPGVVVGRMPQVGLVATEWQTVAAQGGVNQETGCTHAGCSHAGAPLVDETSGKSLKGSLGGPGFTAESLPEVPFKHELMGLAPAARTRAEQRLAERAFPVQDLASLHVDATGGVFYACRMTPLLKIEEVPVAATSAAAITFDAALSLPLYHSRPSQTTRVDFLDFDGFTMPANTAWENWDSSGVTYVGKVCKPFSIDSDYTTFSNAELSAINLIWQEVSELYAPFDIDVTTEQPATWTNYTGHVLITPDTTTDGTALPHQGAAGVAYIGVYGHDEENYNSTTVYQPAFVLADTRVGAIPYMAQAAAHEFGHQLGLHHDGLNTATTANPNAAYYGGHASGSYWWAPVMGGGDVANIPQWSKGEYYDANDTEDDLAIIASSLHYVTDDHGGTNATATSVTASGTSVSGSGVISQTNETDRFRIIGGAGTWSFTCTPALLPVTTVNSALGATYNLPVLDVKLALYNSSGSLMASTTAGTAMSTSLNATIATAGTYYLEVRPTGVGSPTSSSPSGFTSYGSLGTYSWSGTVPITTMPACTIGVPTVATIGGSFMATWTFSEAVSGFTVDDITVNGGSASATISGFSGSGTTYTATITPTDSGSLVVSIPAGVATSDSLGVSNSSASASVPVRPDCSISVPTSVIQGTSFTATITFTSAVTGFAVDDIVVTGGSVSSVSGSSGTTFTATVVPTATGTINLNVSASVVTDSETGAVNTAASATTTATAATSPTCTITAPSTGMVGTSFPITMTFSAPVTGFVEGDIVVTGGTLSNFSGSGTTYTANVLPTSVGTLTISIAAGVATGAYSNANTATSVTVSVAAAASPTCTITAPSTGTVGTSFSITMTFSASVTGFVAGDVAVTGGTLSGFSGSGTIYTATVLPASAGTLTISIAAGVATGAYSNANAAASATVTIAAVPSPTCIITAPSTGTAGTSFTIVMTFSASVAGFTASDVTVTDGTLSGFSGSGTTYMATVMPTSAGTLTISIAAGVATGAYSNATAAASATVTVSAAASSTASGGGGGGGSGCGLGSGTVLAGLFLLAGWLCFRRREQP
jgi:hypothetical protein